MNALGVVGSVVGRVNKRLGPFLLRNGISLRYTLGGGIIRDNPTLDHLLLINWGQKIVSTEVTDDIKRLLENKPKDQSVSTLRVSVLEKCLRPVLLKNERWSDVTKWRFQNRFLSWARFEFLKAKYGPKVKDAFIGYPQLKALPQLKRRKHALELPFAKDDSPATTNMVFLPPTSMIQDAFELYQWTNDKNQAAHADKMEKLAAKLGGDVYGLRGGAMLLVNVPKDADTSSLKLEEVLELVGGHVLHCGPFNEFCEEADIYQLWTKEYVERLAKYLLKRSNEFKGETVVVDIGAGDGLLAKYLHSSMGEILLGDAKKKLRRTAPRQKRSRQHAKVPNIVAADDGSWQITEMAVVLRLNVEQALAKYCTSDNEEDDNPQPQQTIVLCSWMPMNVDWTALFRKYDVDEYILIGECDDGQCGANWETWGNPAFISDDITDELKDAPSEQMPLYEVDGYKRCNMDALAKYQFSRFDSSTSKTGRTVSFSLQRKKHA